MSSDPRETFTVISSTDPLEEEIQQRARIAVCDWAARQDTDATVPLAREMCEALGLMAPALPRPRRNR